MIPDVEPSCLFLFYSFGALKKIFIDKYLSEELKGEVYKAHISLSSLRGCEAWSSREDLFKRLRNFHDKCARSMWRVNLNYTFRHHITSNSLIRRLGLLDIDSYFYDRYLLWAGHVARMPMSRGPRKVLASWGAHSQPVGCPQVGRWRTRSNVRVFPRTSMSGSPLRNTGQSGDSRLAQIKNLLVPGG